jgi:hypothetical protein
VEGRAAQFGHVVADAQSVRAAHELQPVRVHRPAQPLTGLVQVLDLHLHVRGER